MSVGLAEISRKNTKLKLGSQSLSRGHTTREIREGKKLRKSIVRDKRGKVEANKPEQINDTNGQSIWRWLASWRSAL